MNRLALKDIFRAVIAPTGNESQEAEYLIDSADNQLPCSDEFCVVSWKPLPVSSDLGDEPCKS